MIGWWAWLGLIRKATVWLGLMCGAMGGGLMCGATVGGRA